MNRSVWRYVAATLSLIPLVCTTPSWAQVSVLTQHNDNQRTGANLRETILNTANVNSKQFGKLFSIPADGEIYTQPLYVPNVIIPGKGAHNVVFFETMNNSVYAHDADTGERLWCKNFGAPIPAGDVQFVSDISYSVGILGTPVVDPKTNIIYFVNCNKYPDGTYHQFLNALYIATGNPISGSPREIVAQYNGINFDPMKQNPRPAVTLANGNIYLAWSSHNDIGPYHGWVIGYQASDLTQKYAYVDTPRPSDWFGGIWMSGQGLTLDSSGNLYFASGNGAFDPGGAATGNSYVKLSPTLTLLDWFTPHDSDLMNSYDADLGSCGLLGIPNTHYIVGGSKFGVVYVVDGNKMGHFNSATDNVVQEFQGVLGTGSSHIHGSPIFYAEPKNGPTVYVWGENDFLRAFAFDTRTGTLNSTPLAMSTMTAPMTNANGAMPGGILSLSANNNTPQTGIVWASTPYDSNANNAVAHGVLHAFDAETLQEIWSDKENATRDDIGRFAKFCPPTIANGRVYIPNFGSLGAPNGYGQLNVYGLLSAAGTAIDCGGGANGAFLADSGFTGGTARELPPTITVDTSGLVTPAPAAVYRSWREGTSPSGFSYQIPNLTPRTTYRVRLEFIEPEVSAVGKRRFNVSLNGVTVLRTFDILSTTGGRRYRATAQQFTATASAAGTITVGFLPVIGNPVCCGITVAPATSVDYSSGFETAPGLSFNGSARLAGTGPSAQLTHEDNWESGSIFTLQPVNIRTFHTRFSFQPVNAVADGFTFTIQSNAPNVLGDNGGGLGYAGIPNSVAVKFDLYNNAGEGNSSVGLFLNGAVPTIPATDLAQYGIDLHSGHVFNVALDYNGKFLNLALQDMTTGARYTTTYVVNIPTAVGGTTAFVGFTGGTGGAGAQENILNWTFTSDLLL